MLRLIFLFLLIPAISLHSQTAAVSGMVLEEGNGEVIIGATIRIAGDSSGSTRGTLRGGSTNKFGYYSVTGLLPGRYQLSVRSIGYAGIVREIEIPTPAADLRIDVRLAPQVELGSEVVVTAERDAEAAGSISSIDIRPEFIQQLPAIGGEVDILRSLQLLPGVAGVSEISSGLYVRGGSPDQNLTLLDGVIVYNPSHLGGFLSTFNSDAVRDIRLIKGAFPAEYGGRLSSVLDMTMREGSSQKISGVAGVSLINSRLTLEGPIGENATFMVSGRRMYLDLLTPLLPEDEEVPRYYFYDFNAKVNYRISPDDRIFLSGYFGRDVLDGPPEERDAFNINWGNATGNLRWMHVASPSLFTNFSLIYTDYNFSTLFENPDTGPSGAAFKSVSGIKDLMLRAEAQYYPREDHIIKAGIEATEHQFRADASAEVEDFEAFERDPTLHTSLDASLYLQDEWTITPLLSANIGGRIYYFQSGNYLRAEPRISAAYIASDQISIKGAFSTGNQFLHLVTRNDLALPTDVWFPSTANVLPATGWQGVLGIEATPFGQEYLLAVEGYYKSMDNLLEYKDTASFSLDVPLESSFARGSGVAYGLEFFLNKRIGEVTGWVGYTLAWTRRTFPELNRGREFYPRYDRRHDVSVVLTYRLGESWELGATWVYGTGQAYTVATGQYYFQDPVQDFDFADRRLDYTERNGYRLPPFHKLDLNFMHSFGWFDLDWRVSLNIYNAYNQKNVFAQYMQQDFDGTGNGTQYSIRRITLFPIIPTVGLSCRF